MLLQFFLGAILRSNNGTPQIIAKTDPILQIYFAKELLSCAIVEVISRVESQYLLYITFIFSYVKYLENRSF